jgi:DNA-binding XRE family transcriptional regulator
MSPIEPAFSIRETAICPCCRLTQYATASGHNVASTTCRRCGKPIGIVYYKFQPPPASEENGCPDRTSIQRSIGAFIRRLRIRRQISQEVLAGRIAMHRTVVTRAEGGRFLNLAIMLRAARALDLEIDEIFVRVRDRHSGPPEGSGEVG